MSSSLNQNKNLAKNLGTQRNIDLNSGNGRHMLVNNYMSLNMDSINNNASTMFTKTTGNQTSLLTQGKYSVTTSNGQIALTSGNTSSNAIVLNASNTANGGITFLSGSGGLTFDTIGPIDITTSGDVIFGSNTTGNITLESNLNINLLSDFVNIIASEHILLQTTAGGEIIFDTNGNTAGVALKVTTDGNVLVNEEVSLDDYQLEVFVSSASNTVPETNGVEIISENMNISPELRVKGSDPDGGNRVINTFGVYSSNSSFAKYRDYIGFQYGTQIIPVEGPEFVYNDIGKKIYFQQDSRTTTIIDLGAIILPVDSTYAPDTLTAGGTYTGLNSIVIKIEIDGTSAYSGGNTFRWSTDAGATWADTYVPIAWALNQRYPLTNGVYISFSDNGAASYAIGQYWIVLAKITAIVDSNLYIAGSNTLSNISGNVVLTVSNNTPVLLLNSNIGSNIISGITGNMSLSRVQTFYTSSPYSAYLGTVTNSDLVIKTADQERLRITADGSIGVSEKNIDARLRLTSNFNAPLLVNDNIYVDSSNNGANLLGYQQIPVSTDLNTGGYVVAYESQEWATSNYNIYANYFTANGDKNGISFRVNYLEQGNQVEPHIAKSGNILSDEYMVVWTSNNAGGTYEIRGRIFQNGSEPVNINEDIIISATVASNIKITPRVAGLKDGSYVVTFADKVSSTSNYTIRYAIVSNTGYEVTSGSITTDTGNNYIYPFVAPLSSYDPFCPGGFVVAYQKQLYALDPRYQLQYSIYQRQSANIYVQYGVAQNITNTGTDTSSDLDSFTLTDGLVSVCPISDNYAKVAGGGFLVAYSTNYSGTYDYSTFVGLLPAVTVYGLSSGANGNLNGASGPSPTTGTQTLTINSVNGTFLKGEVIYFEGNDGTFVEKIASIQDNTLLSPSNIVVTLSKDPKSITAARYTSNIASGSPVNNLVWRTQVNATTMVNDRLRDALNPTSDPLDFITQNSNFYAFRPLPVITHNEVDETICVWQNGYEPNVYYRRLALDTGSSISDEGLIGQTVIGLRQVDPYVCPLKTSQGNILGYSINFSSSSLDLSKTGVFQQLIGPDSYLIHMDNQTAIYTVTNDGNMGIGTAEPTALIHAKTIPSRNPLNIDIASVILETSTQARIETEHDTHNINFVNGDGQEMARIKVKYSDNYQDLYPNADNLMAYFKLDETAGELVAHDSGIFSSQSVSMPNAAPTLVQTAQLVNFDVNLCWQTGKINNGLMFNGNNSVLLVPTPTIGSISGSSAELNSLMCRIANNDTFAFSMWTKIDTNVFDNTRYDIFSIGTADLNSASGGAIQFFLKDLDGVGQLHPVIRYNDLSLGVYDFESYSNNIRINNSAWHHLVYNYTGHNFRVWVDGTALEESYTIMGPLKQVTTNLPVYIGSNVAASGNFFRGMMDEIRVYSSALSNSDIARLYTYGSESRAQFQIQTLGANQTYQDYEPGFTLDDTGSVLSANLKNNVYRQITGTLVVTYQNTTVNGLNTQFTKEIRAGDFIYIDNKLNEVDDSGDKVAARSFKVVQVNSDTQLVVNRVIPSILSNAAPAYFSYATIRPSIVSATNLDNSAVLSLDFFGDMVIGAGKSTIANSKLEVRGSGQESENKNGLCLSNTVSAGTYADYARNSSLTFAGFNTAATESLLGKLSVNHAGTGSDNIARMSIELNGANTSTGMNHVASFYGDGAINFGASQSYNLISAIDADFMITGKQYMPLNTAYFSNQNASGTFGESTNIRFYGQYSYNTDQNIDRGALALITVSNDAPVNDQEPTGRIDICTNNYSSAAEQGLGPLSRVAVTSMGNVGIHTRNPNTPFHVGPMLADTADLLTSNIVSINGNSIVFDKNIFVTTGQPHNLLRSGTIEIFDGSNLQTYVLQSNVGANTLFSNTRSITLTTTPNFNLANVGSQYRINYSGLHVNKYGLVNIGSSNFATEEQTYHLTVSGDQCNKGLISFVSNIDSSGTNTVALKYGVDAFSNTVLQMRDMSTANNYVSIFRGPQSSDIRSASSTPFAIAWDYATILVDTTASPKTVTLPVTSAPYSGRKFIIKLTSGSNTVTIDGNGATIDGSANIAINTVNYSRELQTDGYNWYIIGGFSG